MEKNIERPEGNVPAPAHIGIIVDGNRRYAKERGLDPAKGHEAGARTLEKILDYLQRRGVRQVTLYVFSTENFNRSEPEKKALMMLFDKAFDIWFSRERIEKGGIRVNFIGNLGLFSGHIQDKCRDLMDISRTQARFTINMAFGYGGRDEIVHAAREISKAVLSGKMKPEDITEKSFPGFLYLEECPDLIIRTGRRYRTSNFLPWQSAYSEWFFEDKMWPDMDEGDFERIFIEFSERSRTFGK